MRYTSVQVLFHFNNMFSKKYNNAIKNIAIVCFQILGYNSYLTSFVSF